MSVGSSYYNPYAYLQYLLQQNSSSSATAGQTNSAAGPLAQSASGTAASYSSAADGAMLGTGNSSVQFDPQTFFALLGMQMTGGGSSSEMPWSQFGAGDASGTTDVSWGAQVPTGQQGQFGPLPFAGMRALLASADSGASSQTTTNANGSTTYTITYPDGSTVALTTPASAGDTTSSASSNSANSTSTTSSNPLEQLIEMLAQSLNASTAQSADGTSSGLQAVDQGQFAPPPFGGAAALQAVANSGASSQATTNANGSTTYTITYADGSTVTLTTAASAGDTTSSASSNSANSTSTTSSNPLEQLIEMLAQSLNSTASQSASDTSSGQQQSRFGPPPFGGFGGMLAFADSGATAQTTTNANGSTTYTITYPDGSTVTMTTAASSDDATSSDSSSSAASTTAANNNFLEQLIEMQAQLLNSTTPSTVAMA